MNRLSLILLFLLPACKKDNGRQYYVGSIVTVTNPGPAVHNPFRVDEILSPAFDGAYSSVEYALTSNNGVCITDYGSDMQPSNEVFGWVGAAEYVPSNNGNSIEPK